jgi:hypothetical protein
VPQLIDGRVCRNDNIAVAQVCGAENAVARGVPGPALPNEALNLGNLPLRAYADQVLADGAVAYWRLDEISGLTARDSIGGNNGTISGGVTLNQPGALAGDSAMAFNGINGQIAIPNGPAVSGIGLGPLTFEFWLRETVVQINERLLDVSSNGSPTYAGFMAFRPDAVSLGVTMRDPVTSGATLVAQGPLPADGQWRHIVGVLTRGTSDTMSLFINGVLIQTQSGSVTGVDYSLTGNLLLGSLYIPTAGYFFGGFLDEVAIYHTALSPAQILAHYQAGVVVTENIRVGVPGPNPEIP